MAKLVFGMNVSLDGYVDHLRQPLERATTLRKSASVSPRLPPRTISTSVVASEF